MPDFTQVRVECKKFNIPFHTALGLMKTLGVTNKELNSYLGEFSNDTGDFHFGSYHFTKLSVAAMKTGYYSRIVDGDSFILTEDKIFADLRSALAPLEHFEEFKEKFPGVLEDFDCFLEGVDDVSAICEGLRYVNIDLTRIPYTKEKLIRESLSAIYNV